MKTISRFTTAGIAVVSLLLAGCSGAPINTGEANQYTGSANIDTYRGRKISATASGFQLLLFIPISVNSRQERAWNQLLAQAGGDYVTNIKINESWTYGFVGTVYRTTLEATAYPRISGSTGHSEKDSSDYFIGEKKPTEKTGSPGYYIGDQ